MSREILTDFTAFYRNLQQFTAGDKNGITSGNDMSNLKITDLYSDGCA